MVETINDIKINDAKTNDINTYVFSDRHPRLMKQIAYYVASKIAEEWNDAKIMNKSNNKRRKLDNCRSLSVMKYYTEEHKKKGRKIHYTLAKDVKCHYVYQDNDFWFVLKELGDNPSEFQGIQFYQELYMETNASEKVLESFFDESARYYDKYYMDFENAEGKIKVMVNSDGYWENLNVRPRRSLDTIYLPKKQVNLINNDLKKFLKEETRNRFHSLGIPYKRNYLFEGRWGTGKTSFIVALASKFDYNIAILSFHDKLTDLDLMHCLRNTPDKCFLVLEDIDALFQERKKNDDQRNRISFTTLLNVLDGLAHKDGLITFMTTNYKVHLDPALIRPGRIDYVMHFDYTNKEEMRCMFNRFYDLNENDKGKFKEFWEKYRKNVNVRTTTSLLQQYFFKYWDNIEGAIENTDELEEMSDACNQEVKKGMYS
jgi:hypothetical protein